MPDPDALAQLGLLGLFLAALLAGSVLPFPSEGVLAALIAAGQPPSAAVGVATLGNVLGAVTVYLIGWAIARGGRLGERLTSRYDEATLARARAHAERWGGLALLLAWVPIVGDALVLGAGLIRVRWWWALICVSLGKLGRYVVVAWATLQALS